MNDNSVPYWLLWARELQSISQTGLAYSKSEHDTRRYERLREISAEMVDHQSAFSRETVLENFRIQPGYATIKVDVRAAVIKDAKILLVQERSDKRWAMPGGWADVGELPSEMVKREVLEESGFEVIPKKIIGVYDANRTPSKLEFYHAYKIVFLCEITGGHARTSEETMAVDFFDFNALPPLSFYRTSSRYIKEIRAHLRNPTRQTAFD